MQNTNQNQNENMIRCRKCHKWYDKTTARQAQGIYEVYDREIQSTFADTITRYFCPHCGYWHR